MKAIILRFDAPLLSFGGVVVDQHGFIDRFPGRSLVTGLIGNALGWDHREGEKLSLLQSRIRLAARWDVAPKRIVDYQTVDLGQPKMRREGWTTRGRPEHRAGGPARFGTHIRQRHYWADGLMTVALTLTGGGPPDIDDILNALRFPMRPLFLGRKACLPARPLLDPQMPIAEGKGLRAILCRIPIWDRAGRPDTPQGAIEGCWPPEEEEGELEYVPDQRDWMANLPTGTSRRRRGLFQGGGR